MFEPIKTGEQFLVERLCKCKTVHPCTKDCNQWQVLRVRTRIQLQALNTTIGFLQQYHGEIFTEGIIELDYAFYRLVRI